MARHRGTVAEIDLASFRHNVNVVRSLVEPGVKIMAVVKADAYGHGAVPCAQAALEAGAECLGVAVLEEGIELREADIGAPILVLGSIFPNEIQDLLHYHLSPALFHYPLAHLLARQAEKRGKTVGVHVKIDTGMGRLGIPPEEFVCLMQQLSALKNLRVEGVFTHLSSADEPDPDYTLTQLTRFSEALKLWTDQGEPLPPTHCANTAGILKFPQSHREIVRPGIILYGALPSPDLAPILAASEKTSGANRFRPVMQWKTRILSVQRVPKGRALSYGRTFVTERDSLIATLPVGYADGLSRSLSGKMEVLVHGQRAPQVGTICMDLTLIDVTDVRGDVRAEDEVVLFGTQGEDTITADEMAEWEGTISYEVLCNVGKRVPRVYKK